MTTQKALLPVLVSDKYRGTEPWHRFRHFATRYWRVLSQYRLLVSDYTKAVLNEVARSQESPLEFADVRPIHTNNARALSILLQAMCVGHAERMLVFVDPERLSDEVDNLTLLREAAVAHGQKLHINRGAELWARRESSLQCGLQSQPTIGANEALVLLGAGDGKSLGLFAKDHVNAFRLFSNRMVASRSDVWSPSSRTRLLPHFGGGSVRRDGVLEVTKLILEDFCDLGAPGAGGRLCHVILCQGDNREHSDAEIQRLLETIADPRMRVNPMLDQLTAEEWFSQFEQPSLVS